MSDSLFNLTGQYLELVSLADEDDQAFLDTLEGLKGEIAQKADNYCYVMTSIDGKIATVKAEIERLEALKKAMESHKQAMKDTLYTTMLAMDVRELPADHHKIWIKGNGGKQKITWVYDVKNPDAFPEKYRKMVPVVDTDKIRADLENGVELACAVLEPRGEHIEIK